MGEGLDSQNAKGPAPEPEKKEQDYRRRVTVPAAIFPVIAVPPLDRRIWILTLVRFIVTAGSAVVMPFLAMHLAADRGVPLLRIGALWAATSATSALMQWVAGHLGDRFGRRPVLITGMVFRSINLAALGMAVSAESSFFVIAALAIVNGALRAFYDPIAWAVVAALANEDERVAAFSLHRVGSSLGWVAGPLVATLASNAAYGFMFYVAAATTLFAPLAAALIPETRPARPRVKPGVMEALQSGLDPRFVRFLMATVAYFTLQTQMYHLLAVYAATYLHLTRAQVATLFTVNAVMVVLLQLPAVRLIKRLGNTRSLVIGSSAYIVAFASCGLAFNYITLAACVALITLCEILTAPAQQARVTRMAPIGKIARYGGLFGLFQGGAQTVGPLLGVFLTEAISPRGAWFVLAVFGLVAALLYREKREPGVPSPIPAA